MEQLVARQAHNLEVACSSPASATKTPEKAPVEGAFLMQSGAELGHNPLQHGSPYPIFQTGVVYSLKALFSSVFSNCKKSIPMQRKPSMRI